MQRVLIVGSRPPRAALPLPGTENPSRQNRQKIHSMLSDVPGAWYTVVKQCASASQMIEIVEDVARTRPIEVLDILDHGAGGGIMLGNKRLFVFADGELEGADVARALAPSLSETAQIRLLGCKTALESEAGSGQLLLLALSQVLGESRIVFGTIDRVFHKYFRPEKGFVLAQELLYSSLAALDRPAPATGCRGRAIDAHTKSLKSLKEMAMSQRARRATQRTPTSLDRSLSGREFCHEMRSG